MNIEDLTKKIKNVHDGVIGYNDLWWKLCEVNLPQKDKIIASRLIAEASLEYQIKRLIKEWDKKKKINVRFNINGEEFSIEDYKMINDYLRELGSNFFFYAKDIVVAGYRSEIKDRKNIFFLEDAIVSEPDKKTPMILIDGTKYVPKENLVEIVTGSLSGILNTNYSLDIVDPKYRGALQKCQREIKKNIRTKYGITSTRDIPKEILSAPRNNQEKPFFNFIDHSSAHEDGHLNSGEEEDMVEYLADCSDGNHGKSTLGFIREIWKKDKEIGKLYLGLEISYRLFLNKDNLYKDNLLKPLIEIYNSDITQLGANIQSLQENVRTNYSFTFQ